MQKVLVGPSAAADFNFPDLLSGSAANHRFHYKCPFCPPHASAIFHTKNSSMFSIYPFVFHRDERGGKIYYHYNDNTLAT